MDEKKAEKKVFETYEALAGRILEKGYRHNPIYLARKAIVDWDLLLSVDLSEKRVLNVGCFEPIDELVWGKYVGEWVAVDISPASIEVASTIVQKELNPELAKRVRFQIMDAQQLDFSDGSFDVVMSFSVIDHMPKQSVRSKAIHEMARVTKKGGHVVITVPNWWGYYHLLYLRNIRAGIQTDVGFQYFFTYRELKKTMEDAGLTILRFTSDMKNVGDLPRALRAALYPFLFFGDRMGFLALKP